MARAPKTLMEVLYVRTGSFRDTAQVYRLVSAWCVCMRVHDGQDVGIEQFVEWAADGIQSRATTHRQLKLFREAFPGHREPNRLCRDFGLLGSDELDPSIRVSGSVLPA